MNILVTAGSTCVQIDQVRVISNIFKGRTGIEIARVAASLGHKVTILTSHESGVTGQVFRDPRRIRNQITLRRFRTFDELAEQLEHEITSGEFDSVIHSAAVSDYRVASVMDGEQPTAEVANDAKIGSNHGALWLKLVPTAKLVDKIRSPWGFKGQLVKFKLQVGITDEELIAIARKSRRDSEADIIVANCLEWAKEYAYIIGADDQAERVTRKTLPFALLGRLS